MTSLLPPKIPRAPKRSSRWRSQAHCNHVRSYACSIPGCNGRPIEVAHVRLGSGAGIAQKPDDWNTVSLCRDHHQAQHSEGEITFWRTRGIQVETLIAEFCKHSPKRPEIEQVKRERGVA